VQIDPEAHSLAWPNGADFDPATLHDWPKYVEELIKIETTIYLEEELLQSLKRISEADAHSSLSKLIEDALCRFLLCERQKTYDTHELELINLSADRLNQEAVDVLTYQIESPNPNGPRSDDIGQ
jgi:hypothetical protein